MPVAKATILPVMVEPRWIAVALRAAVRPGHMLEVEAAEHAILLYDLNGAVFATAAICPHHSAWLSQGALDGEYVDCPRHMGQFHVPTGKLTRGPSCPPLRTYPVLLRDDRVWVDISEGPRVTGRARQPRDGASPAEPGNEKT